MENFREVAQAFIAEEALIQVPDATALGRELVSLLADEPRRRALGER